MNAVTQAVTETKAVSKLVPRRAPGTRGRRAPNYPDLNFRRIAEAIGVSSTFLGRVMNGRARAGIATAQKLAAYLDWPLDKVAGLYGSKELARKFPYRKQPKQKENRSNAKSIERPGGRGAKQRTISQKARKRKPVPAAVADQTHNRKRVRASGAKAARRAKGD